MVWLIHLRISMETASMMLWIVKAQLGHPVQMVPKALKALKAPKVILVPKVPKVILVPKVPKVIQDPLAVKVSKV